MVTRYKDCETQLNPNNQVSTIMDWAQAAGKATGVVSTNGITDASPAGAYAKVKMRSFLKSIETDNCRLPTEAGTMTGRWLMTELIQLCVMILLNNWSEDLQVTT